MIAPGLPASPTARASPRSGTTAVIFSESLSSWSRMSPCSMAPSVGFEEDDSVFAAMRAEARGYLLKGADKDEMLLAIRAVARRSRLRPGIARRLIQYFGSPPWTSSRTPRSIFPELTNREREILDLIAAGKNNQEIAESPFLSVKTGRNYGSNISTKLQVADREQAIVRAREAGLGQDG